MSLSPTRLHHLAAELMAGAGLSSSRAGVLVRVLDRCAQQPTFAGERLCSSGEPADGLLIVVRGSVRVTVDALADERPDRRRRGDERPGADPQAAVRVEPPLLVGALPMVDGGRHLRSCTALGPGLVLRMEPALFAALLDGADAGAEVFRELLLASMFASLSEGTRQIRHLLAAQPGEALPVRAP